MFVDICVHLRDGEESFDLQQICRQASVLQPHQTLLIQLLCDGINTPSILGSPSYFPYFDLSNYCM